MDRRHLLRRAAGVREVARTLVQANGPARLRPAADLAPAATLDHDTALPELDLTIPPWSGTTEHVAGVDLFVRHTPTTADGPVPTAVYVHGLGGASTNWTDLAAQLAPFVDGHAPDLPGFGRSGPAADDDYSLRAHARVVTAYLDALAAAGRGPVHLFGNSMGGAIAIRVAARRPDLVRTLTLISPAVPDLRAIRDDDPRMPLLMLPGVGAYASRKLAEAPPIVRAEGMVRLVYGDPSKVPDHRIREAAEELESRGGTPYAGRALIASMQGLVGTWFTAKPWRDLAAITAPTLVVWGDRDRLVSPALAPRVALTVPRGRLLVLPGVGHVSQLEDPQTTARAWLGTLWRSCLPSGSATGGASSSVRS